MLYVDNLPSKASLLGRVDPPVSLVCSFIHLDAGSLLGDRYHHVLVCLLGALNFFFIALECMVCSLSILGIWLLIQMEGQLAVWEGIGFRCPLIIFSATLSKF